MTITKEHKEEVAILLDILQRATIRETIFFKTIKKEDGTLEQVPLDYPMVMEVTVLTAQDIAKINTRIMSIVNQA